MAAGLVREEQEGPGVTVVTVPDTVWALHIPGVGEEDPLSREPVFQRQVVSSQVVAARIDGSQAGRVKTVGGRSLLVTREADQLTVNDVPVTSIVSAGNNEVTSSSFSHTGMLSQCVSMCLNVSQCVLMFLNVS